MGAPQIMEIYQFKVTLIGIAPPIWRRIQVLGTYTLAQLHGVLQVAMGWEDYHLYMFQIGNKKYGRPDMDEDGDVNLIDARRTRLSSVLPGVGTTFTYLYDYGDDWQHEVKLEQIAIPAPDTTYPRCIAGERRCPPEDVGGIGGYSDYLEAMADPQHEDHGEVIMWRGPFDPEELSIGTINQELAKKFRSKPKTGAPRSAVATAKVSAKTSRFTKTFNRPVIPQRKRIPIKAGETVPLELNERERDLIISRVFADELLTERLRTASPGQRPVFHFTLEELDELVGHVAAEANHAKNKVLQEQLDELCERMEAVLRKYTDADA